MNKANWRTGEGYPTDNTPINDWRLEFCLRRKEGLKGVPRFEVSYPEKKIEIFNYPVMYQINEDGSFMGLPEVVRNATNRMILEFALDEDISRQLQIAKRWLMGNQSFRYKNNKIRLDKYKTYLRLLDADAEGVSKSDIARVIYPHIDNSYPDFSASKQVSKSLSTAKRITDIVCLGKLLRK